MSIQAWFIFVCHLPILVWLVWDRFARVNRWADWFEDNILPKWARWSTQGDWISWFQHAAFTLAASLYVGALTVLAPESFLFGARFGAWVGVGCYLIRETMNAWANRKNPNVWRHPYPRRVGWALDGIMDVLLPLSVALLWSLL